MREKKYLVAVTVLLPPDQLRWIDEKRFHRSTFARKAIEKMIEEESGYKLEAARLEKEILELEHQTVEKKARRIELEGLQTEFDATEKFKEVEDTVRTAIYNIQYRDVDDVARDLRPVGADLKPAEFRNIVEKVWQERHG